MMALLRVIFSLFSLVVIICSADEEENPKWELVNSQTCGIGESSDRIIGGQLASPGQFPWMAILGYKIIFAMSLATKFQCGGSLINDQYVLTAAHCLANLGSQIVTQVRLGDHRLECPDSECQSHVQTREPSKIFVHPEYLGVSYDMRNDIGLIRMNRPVEFTAWVTPICVPHGDLLTANFVGKTADVAGWGSLDTYVLEMSSSLYYVTVPIVDDKLCSDMYNGTNLYNFVCAGGVENKDSCKGDSGGPLMRVEEIHGEPRYMLLGLVSFGKAVCGDKDSPAVYTKIAKFMPWVLEKLEP